MHALIDYAGNAVVTTGFLPDWLRKHRPEDVAELSWAGQPGRGWVPLENGTEPAPDETLIISEQPPLYDPARGVAVRQWQTVERSAEDQAAAVERAASVAVGRVKAEYAHRLAAGWVHGASGKMVQIDGDSQRNLMAARDMAQAGLGRWTGGGPSSWLMADNSEITLTATEMVALAEAAAVYADDLVQTVKAHRRALTALATDTTRPAAERIAELAAYDISAFWPQES